MKSLVNCGLIAVALFVQPAAQDAYAQRAANVVMDSMLGKVGAGELVGWMAYGVSMSNYLSKSGLSADLKGRYEPSFEVELVGRQAQATVWREINQKKPERSVYMDDLVRVSDAGFMREYVWRYYRRPAWGEVPSNLRLEEFRAWVRDNLASHVPFTGSRLEYPQE